MSKNQLHGKQFEGHVKCAFPGSSDYQRQASSIYDIEKEFDLELHLPTSVKVVKYNNNNEIICLADARRFWKINKDYRLIVGVYMQKSNIKEFYALYEFIITKNEHDKLVGNISYNQIEDLHNKICSFKPGQHNEARLFVKNNIKQLGKSSIILNPKIDSFKQRRLQCSIYMNDLMKNISMVNIYGEGTNNEFYKNIDVKFRVLSSIREFKK